MSEWQNHCTGTVYKLCVCISLNTITWLSCFSRILNFSSQNVYSIQRNSGFPSNSDQLELVTSMLLVAQLHAASLVKITFFLTKRDLRKKWWIRHTITDTGDAMLPESLSGSISSEVLRRRRKCKDCRSLTLAVSFTANESAHEDALDTTSRVKIHHQPKSTI